MNPRAEPGERLERALAMFLTARPTTRAEADRLLADHPDLADLLTPMLDTVGAQPTLGAEPCGAPDDDARVLGDFRLVRELGRGGMGIVYEAWQRSLDRRVAVKVLAPALVASPSAVARFRREATAAGRLRHGNIVEVYGFGSADGQHFFAMQLVDGLPLHECAARFREPARAIAVATQLTNALVHAHENGLVHRDVKPANVLVQADDSILLTDFGIARDEALPSLTQEGGFLGTLDYASPEQVRGEPIDARTDVWAVGVLLHELLSGKSPFAGPTQEATLHAILTGEPAGLQGRPGISNDIAAVVDRALAKHRTRRYASAAALLADLRALQAGEPVSARLPTTLERLQRWAHREPWRAVAALLFAIGLPVAGGGIGWLLAQAPMIQVGELRTAEVELDHRLAKAWLHFTRGEHQDGLACLPPTEPDEQEEVVVARVLLHWSVGDSRAVSSALRDRDTPAMRLLRKHIMDSQYDLDPRTSDPWESFVSACLHYRAARREDSVGASDSYRSAMQLLLRASLLSPTPRAGHLTLLARTAKRCGEDEIAAFADQALLRHFGNDPAITKLLALNDEGPASTPADPSTGQPAAAATGPTSATLFDLGARKAKEGDSIGAEADLRACVQLDNQHARAWHALGQLLWNRGDRSGATAAFRCAVAADPGLGIAWNNLGNALADQGDSQGAHTALENAVRLNPDYAKGHYNLGVTKTQLGDNEGAVLCYERALTIDPSYRRAQINLATSLMRSGRKQESLPAAERAVELAPKDLDAIGNLATFALQLQRFDRAAWAADQWVELAPTSARAWHAVARAGLGLGDVGSTARALLSATRALEFDPGRTLYRATLVEARAASGDTDGARDLGDELLRDPDLSSDLRTRIERLLQQLPR